MSATDRYDPERRGDFDNSLVRDILDHGLLDPCDADACLQGLRAHPELRIMVAYMARVAASLERIAEQMPPTCEITVKKIKAEEEE